MPGKIWKRYKDRTDLLSLDHSKILIGGFAAAGVGELETSAAQRAFVAGAEAKMAQERAELDALRAELETREAEMAARGGNN